MLAGSESWWYVRSVQSGVLGAGTEGPGHMLGGVRTHRVASLHLHVSWTTACPVVPTHESQDAYIPRTLWSAEVMMHLGLMVGTSGHAIDMQACISMEQHHAAHLPLCEEVT